MLCFVIVIVIVCFLALQFYAILLGGVFNIARTSKPHQILEQVALIVGYFLAGVHAIFHIIRGVVFRVKQRHIWPPSWLLGR